MAAAEIYVKQMRKLKHGDALWVPESPVEVGDVGFLDDGAFYRLFNTILPSNHPLQSVGVPATFEPLVIPPNFWNETPNYFVHGTALKSQSLKEKRIGLEASSDLTATGGGIYFETSSDKGAALIFKHKATRIDINKRCALVSKYIARHIDSWYDFASGLGYALEEGDIVFVTGCDKTPGWAIAAFSGSSNNLSFEFRGGFIPIAGAGFVLAGGWTNMGTVQHRSGPDDTVRFASAITDLEGDALPSEPPSAQTTFVRIKKAYRRRSLIPRVLRAAAEPRTDDRQDRGSDFAQSLPSISSDISLFSDNSDFLSSENNNIHPLDSLLRYIVDNSNCEVAIAGHDDLHDLFDNIPEAYEDLTNNILRRTCITIHGRVGQLDLLKPSPSIESSFKEITSVEDFDVPLSSSKFSSMTPSVLLDTETSSIRSAAEPSSSRLPSALPRSLRKPGPSSLPKPTTLSDPFSDLISRLSSAYPQQPSLHHGFSYPKQNTEKAKQHQSLLTQPTETYMDSLLTMLEEPSLIETENLAIQPPSAIGSLATQTPSVPSTGPHRRYSRTSLPEYIRKDFPGTTPPMIHKLFPPEPSSKTSPRPSILNSDDKDFSIEKYDVAAKSVSGSSKKADKPPNNNNGSIFSALSAKLRSTSHNQDTVLSVRQTRRQMLASEMSEEMRKSLLWEHKINSSHRIARPMISKPGLMYHNEKDLDQESFDEKFVNSSSSQLTQQGAVVDHNTWTTRDVEKHASTASSSFAEKSQGEFSDVPFPSDGIITG